EPPASSVPTTAATQQDSEPAGPPDFDEEPPLPDSPYAPSIQLDDEAEQAEATAEPDPVASMNWEDLRKTVAVCERCELHSTRTQSVFGVGHPNARLMVIGEAPGRDEDLQGEPFVGKAGKLLDQMLKAAGFERKDVFIANILKCRPPKNRDPKAEEAAACRAYLNRQIELVQPEVILSVGRISAQNLLDSEQSIGRLRGQAHRLPGRDVPLFVTYHPAYLLRQPAEKRKAWADLQMVMSALGL
ncbi:MAG: uracil-DNA glycosylase, partial [Gammaproteobacteria bacterium]